MSHPAPDTDRGEIARRVLLEGRCVVAEEDTACAVCSGPITEGTTAAEREGCWVCPPCARDAVANAEQEVRR